MGVRQKVGKLLGPPDLDEVLMVFRVIGKTPGVMLDIGAHHGSSCKPFLEHGWTVHAFEPDPGNRAILSSRCPGAIIDHRAISQVDGDDVSLFTSDVSTGISTLSPFHPTHTPTVTVQTVRLDTYIHEKDIRHVDFVKTDIEGFDLLALSTFPWGSHRPRAVVCEYEDNKTARLGYDVHDLARFLEQQHFAVWVSQWEPIVEYGTRHKWRRFMRYPADIASDTWGNLVAVEPSLVDSMWRASKSTIWRLRVRQSVDRLRRAS